MKWIPALPVVSEEDVLPSHFAALNETPHTPGLSDTMLNFKQPIRIAESNHNDRIQLNH